MQFIYPYKHQEEYYFVYRKNISNPMLTAYHMILMLGVKMLKWGNEYLNTHIIHNAVKCLQF